VPIARQHDEALSNQKLKRNTTMFAKQAVFAAIALTIAGGAFAQSAERNVFDTETNQRMPAAQSANGLTREAVQAEYIAKRDAKGISEYNPHAWYFAQNADSAPAIVALFAPKSTDAQAVVTGKGRTRAEVRAEVLASRASGEMNPFDNETYPRMPAVRQPAPTALAQK
jgi:hypothetical protein